MTVLQKINAALYIHQRILEKYVTGSKLTKTKIHCAKAKMGH